MECWESIYCAVIGMIDMCEKIDEKNPDVQEKEVRRMEVWEYLEWKMGEKNVSSSKKLL